MGRHPLRRPLALLGLLTAALAAGCAAPARVPPPSPPPGGSGMPDLLTGVPAAVLAGRAVFELESGDPPRRERARRLLRALDGAALDAWLLRASAAPPGSPARRELLAVLADRGEVAAGFAAEEEVAACLDLVLADPPGGRGAMLGTVRLRSLGEAALPPLMAEARVRGERSASAVRLLRLLGVPERDLPEPRP